MGKLTTETGYDNLIKILNKDDYRYAIDINKKVFVYRNLHKNCWSVRQNGLVKIHTPWIRLGVCKFKVNEGGRQRVLAQKRKNVHAGVEGLLLGQRWSLKGLDGESIEYNPYKNKTFVKKLDGSSVRSALAVILDITEGVIGYDLK